MKGHANGNSEIKTRVQRELTPMYMNELCVIVVKGTPPGARKTP